jgi:X-Pro dipeptidyl-peptidase
MMLRRLGTLAALVALLAGCFGPSGDGTPVVTSAGPAPSDATILAIQENLSQPRFPATPLFEEYSIASFDGTQLRLRIYRPDAPPEWKAPIILHMSPYFGLEGIASDGLDAWLLSHFIPRGYAVALNDVRGTGNSGGCLEHTGRNEAKDGYAVVEHLASRPWSNARVGMVGISYDAETQQATLTTQPPHLRTIVPVESIAGLYDHVYFDGVPYTSEGLMGAGSYAAQGMVPPRPGVDADEPTKSYDPLRVIQRPGCHPTNIAERSDPRGDFTQYWQDRELRSWLPDIHATSVFFVHGLADWNVKPIHIAGWYNELAVPKHAWIGQWQHEFPDQDTVPTAARRSDWHFAVHRWFDHWLLDIDTGVMDEPAVQVQDSSGRWRLEDAWPPLDAPASTWFLSSTGTLSQSAPEAAEAAVSYQDNGLSFEDGRGESVSWTSEPLAAELAYAGQPWLRFQAIVEGSAPAVPAPGTHFAAHLIDVAPDGTSVVVNRGYLDAQHRMGRNESTPVANGQAFEYVLKMYPQDDVLQPGHRLRLTIGAVDDWIQPDGTQARVTILVGGENASVLTLPSTPSSPRFFEPPTIRS